MAPTPALEFVSTLSVLLNKGDGTFDAIYANASWITRPPRSVSRFMRPAW